MLVSDDYLNSESLQSPDRFQLVIVLVLSSSGRRVPVLRHEGVPGRVNTFVLDVTRHSSNSDGGRGTGSVTESHRHLQTGTSLVDASKGRY